MIACIIHARMVARALIWSMGINACAVFRLLVAIAITKWIRVSRTVVITKPSARQHQIIWTSLAHAPMVTLVDYANRISMNVSCRHLVAMGQRAVTYPDHINAFAPRDTRVAIVR